jgi:hypothetical protein
MLQKITGTLLGETPRISGSTGDIAGEASSGSFEKAGPAWALKWLGHGRFARLRLGAFRPP